MSKKHTITATITPTHVEFRNFPPDCGWFDPIDDLMFLPLQLNLTPDSMGPEYIQVENAVEVIYPDTFMNTFHGVRWDLTFWNAQARKKLAWFIVKDIRERFKDIADVVLTH